MGQIQGYHIFQIGTIRPICYCAKDAEEYHVDGQGADEDSVELFWFFHRSMQVYDDTVPLEIEHSHAEKERNGRSVEVVQVLRQFGMIIMVLNAISSDNEHYNKGQKS